MTLTTHSNLSPVKAARPQTRVLVPFSEEVIGFLSALSRRLRDDRQAKVYPDVMTLAFWCRKSHLLSLKAELLDHHHRLGLGTVFHITPGNVPLNFAYSCFFGLLAGNRNIVRLPSINLPQVDLVKNAILQLASSSAHRIVGAMIELIQYQSESSRTLELSESCDARLIWGSDQTVNKIRQIPIPPRAIELTFPDRYSFAVIAQAGLVGLSEAQFEGVCRRFFNDTYLMDQNACSSPHLVVWLGDSRPELREAFWARLAELVDREYTLSDMVALSKYTRLCETSIDSPLVADVRFNGYGVYRIQLDSLAAETIDLRGNSGYFFEYHANSLYQLIPFVSKKIQTLTYLGVNREDLLNLVIDQRLEGIDRIVPLGRALEIEPVWDGVNLITSLSRVVMAR